MQKPSERIKELSKTSPCSCLGMSCIVCTINGIVKFLDEQAEQQAKKAEECKHEWGIKYAVKSTKISECFVEYICFKCQETMIVKPYSPSEPVKECEHKNMSMFLGIGKCPDCGIIVQNSVIQENSEQTSLVPLDYEKAIEFSSIDHNLSYREKCIIKQICQKFGQPKVLSVEELNSIIFRTTGFYNLLLSTAIHEALKEKNKN